MNSSFTPQRKQIRQAKIMTGFAVLFAACLPSVNAMAMTVPAAGSFAYDLYDIGVNQILLGPIGFIAGVACMVFAAILAIRQMILPDWSNKDLKGKKIRFIDLIKNKTSINGRK